MQIKPGLFTTEFWASTITAIVSVLAGFGVIGPGDQGQIADAIKAIVGGVIAVWSIVSYIENRSSLKERELDIDATKK